MVAAPREAPGGALEIPGWLLLCACRESGPAHPEQGTQTPNSKPPSLYQNTLLLGGAGGEHYVIRV